METRSHDNYDEVSHSYVHVPFCARICPYCAFYKTRGNHAEMERFCSALITEISRVSLRPRTIYFGGGTPTALTTWQLERVLAAFHARFDLSELQEWTFEANPGSVSQRKAQLLHQAGVNRISLGVQSFDDELLQLLGREHSAAQAEESFALLRGAGFTNINIDLMFGLPNQTLAQWRATLESSVALQPDHISAYCLTFEEDTDFFLRHARGEMRSDPDFEAAFFDAAFNLLGRAGLQQYEISNYARPGFESLHNQAYWKGADYLGFGPGAVSTIGLRRWQNVADHHAYAEQILGGRKATTGEEVLTPEMKRVEAIALSLRTSQGVPARWVEPWSKEIGEFVRIGLMQAKSERFVLTPAGRLLADSVAETFV